MADRQLSPLRRIMRLIKELILAALLAYALSLHIISERAGVDVDHGPQAKQDLKDGLDEYYEQRNKK